MIGETRRIALMSRVDNCRSGGAGVDAVEVHTCRQNVIIAMALGVSSPRLARRHQLADVLDNEGATLNVVDSEKTEKAVLGQFHHELTLAPVLDEPIRTGQGITIAVGVALVQWRVTRQIDQNQLIAFLLVHLATLTSRTARTTASG